MGDQGGMSAPAFPSFCPQCGASLNAPRCVVCFELSHLRFAAGQLEQWSAAGQLAPEHAAALRVGLLERSDAAVGRALHPDPPPPPAPDIPVPPTEWQRFQQATGISWVYGLGVLFLAAAIAWLVIESARSDWGRWVLAGVISLLALGAGRAGWWLLESQGLRMGGQAVLVLGGLLAPAALFALATAITRPIAAVVAAAIWAAGTVLAVASTRRGRLGSQLVLANLLASLAAVEMVQAVAGPGDLAMPWYGLVAALLAAGNLAAAGRWQSPTGEESHELLRATRVSVGFLLGAGALAVLRLPLLDLSPQAGTVLSGLAVGGCSVAAGALWRRRWMLYAGAGMASFAAALAGEVWRFSATAGPLLQALTAAALLQASAPERRGLRAAAWVPLAVGGLLAAGLLLRWYYEPSATTPAPDAWLVLGSWVLAWLAIQLADDDAPPWASYAAGLTLSAALAALLLWPGVRLFEGLVGGAIGSGLALAAAWRRDRGAGYAAIGFGWLALGGYVGWHRQLTDGPLPETAGAFVIVALASGAVAGWGERRPVGWAPWIIAAMVATAGLLAAVTGQFLETQALGVAVLAAAAIRANRTRAPAVRVTGLLLAGAAAFGVVAEPPRFGLLALVLAQFVLLAGAEESEGPAVAGGLAWLCAAFVWYAYEPGLERLPWLLHAAAAAVVGVGWIISGRRHGMAAGLTTLAVGYGILGWDWWPERQSLGFGIFALLAEASGRFGRSDEARQEADGVAALVGTTAILFAIGLDRRVDATVLLSMATIQTGWLAVGRRVSPVVPVLLGNLTAAYVLLRWYPVSGTADGLRFAALGLANALLAVPARRSVAWRDALLICGGLIGLGSIAGLLPPDRNTVLGACFLGTAAMTAAALRREVRWQDVGVGCYLAALFMVLHDLAEHGHPGLDPYRAVDLWLVPLGLYVVLIVERRSERRTATRRAGVALILGSVLISALLADGVGHDALLLLATAGTVMLGIERDDPVVRWAGPATFLMYVEIEVWRRRPEWGTWLLIAMLIVVGLTALVAGFRQETMSKD